MGQRAVLGLLQAIGGKTAIEGKEGFFSVSVFVADELQKPW